jgi:hypothetical protein
MILSWEYIAGFFDGEEHVSVLIRNNNVGMCQQGDRGKIVLTDIAETCEANKINCGVYAANEGKRKVEIYRLSVQGRESCRRFLIHVLPFLRVKRIAALDALRFFTLYPPIRGGVVHRKFLQRRGFMIGGMWNEHTFTPKRKARKQIQAC